MTSPERIEILSDNDARQKSAVELGLGKNAKQEEINESYDQYENLSDEERQKINDEGNKVLVVWRQKE